MVSWVVVIVCLSGWQHSDRPDRLSLHCACDSDGRATTVHTVHSNLGCRAIGVELVGVELAVMPVVRVVPLTRTQTFIDRKAKRSLSDGEGLRSGGCICQGWNRPATVDKEQQ